MERLQFTRAEVRLAEERRLKYQGTAKVSLDDICFHSSLPPKVDETKLDRIRRIFHKEKCRRLDIRNHITAVVSREHLDIALRDQGQSPNQLLTNTPGHYPWLQFPSGQLQCLHGQHRIQVAKELLPQTDRWWTVDIYLEDISSELRTTLLEEYSNEKPPSDGEIYRKIRQYDSENNTHFRKRWWSRLSENKEKRLKALLDHDELRDAFDRLLPIPGLWAGLRIGSLGSLMAIKCEEEILHYLSHIREFWYGLLNFDSAALIRVDQQTVEGLQLSAPGVSRKDSRKVHGLVSSGQVFSGFTQREREDIWERLQMVTHLIPSLHTFFEDLKYLRACAECIKRLLATNYNHPTIWTTMQHMFDKSRRDQETGVSVQVSETRARDFRGTLAEQLDLGYRQVWLYVMRHYPQMAREPQRHDVLAKVPSEQADEVVVHEMAVLAHRLGFRSEKITKLVEQSPDRQIARVALLKARKPGRYQYKAESFDRLVDQVIACFAQALAEEDQAADELIVDTTMKQSARCGLPQARAHRQDLPFLFFDRLHSESGWASEQISTLFVRRCVYLAFFGPSSATAVPIDSLDHREIRVALDAGERSIQADGPFRARTGQDLENEAAAELSRMRQEAADRDAQHTAEIAELSRVRQEAADRDAQHTAEIARLQSELASKNNLVAEIRSAEGKRCEEHLAEISRLQGKIEFLRNQPDWSIPHLQRLYNDELNKKSAEHVTELQRLQAEINERDKEIERLRAISNNQVPTIPQQDSVPTESDDQPTVANSAPSLQTFKFQKAKKSRPKGIQPINLSRSSGPRSLYENMKLPVTFKIYLYEAGEWRNTTTIKIEETHAATQDNVLNRVLVKYQRKSPERRLELIFYDDFLRTISRDECLITSYECMNCTVLISFERLPNTPEFYNSTRRLMGLEPCKEETRKEALLSREVVLLPFFTGSNAMDEPGPSLKRLKNHGELVPNKD